MKKRGWTVLMPLRSQNKLFGFFGFCTSQNISPALEDQMMTIINTLAEVIPELVDMREARIGATRNTK
jgi:hypothetical protein